MKGLNLRYVRLKFVVFVVLLVVAGYVYVRVRHQNEVVARVQCTGRLFQLGELLQRYREAYGKWPSDIVDKVTGEKLLSWRVPLLEFMGTDSTLLSKFRLDERWDSAENIKLVPLIPTAYQCPASSKVDRQHFVSSYSWVDVPDVFQNRHESEFHIPKSDKRIIVAEVNGSLRAWTIPDDDLKEPPSVNTGSPSSNHGLGTYILLEDGSVELMLRK